MSDVTLDNLSLRDVASFIQQLHDRGWVLGTFTTSEEGGIADVTLRAYAPGSSKPRKVRRTSTKQIG